MRHSKQLSSRGVRHGFGKAWSPPELQWGPGQGREPLESPWEPAVQRDDVCKTMVSKVARSQKESFHQACRHSRCQHHVVLQLRL